MAHTGSEKPAGWNRRAFLKGSGLAALMALLEGCGLPVSRTSGTPSPTRTPKPSFTPPVGHTATLSPTATGTPTAEATPSPGATEAASATPTPTDAPPQASPTPTATPTPENPFPPGPPSKLGLFVGHTDPQVFDLVRTGNVALVKTLELDPIFAKTIKDISPHTILVGRIFLGQINLDGLDPQAEAQRFVEQLLPIASDTTRMSAFDAWEAYNEPVPANEEQMGRLADFEAARTELLAGHGIRSVVGNFATGHPDLAWWPLFRPALEAVAQYNGYLGLHEYSAPSIFFNSTKDDWYSGVGPADEGWYTLRYRKVYRQQLGPMGLKVPLLITECGVDGTVGGRPGPEGKGWRDFTGYWEEQGWGPDGAMTYVNQLIWYDTALQQDDYVKGAAIFAISPTEGWDSFDIRGEVARLLGLYLSVHPKR